MPKNKIEDLRNHLFETLEALKDDENPMDLDRAKAICNVAGKIIDSARVEVAYVKATDALPATDFFGDIEGKPRALPSPPFEDLRQRRPRLTNGKAS